MERITHLLAPAAGLMLSFFGWLLPSATGGDGDTIVSVSAPRVAVETETPVFEIESDDPLGIELAEWARERFELAGLELPAVKVTFHDDEAGCAGNTGLFRPGDPAEVHLCSRVPLDSKGARIITLHELGHAWAETRTDADARTEFLAERGLGSWADPSLPTWQWGAEHAAETLSWGLMDEAVRIVRIPDADSEALAGAFRALTGIEALTPDARS